MDRDILRWLAICEWHRPDVRDAGHQAIVTHPVHGPRWRGLIDEEALAVLQERGELPAKDNPAEVLMILDRIEQRMEATEPEMFAMFVAVRKQAAIANLVERGYATRDPQTGDVLWSDAIVRQLEGAGGTVGGAAGIGTWRRLTGDEAWETPAGGEERAEVIRRARGSPLADRLFRERFRRHPGVKLVVDQELVAAAWERGIDPGEVDDLTLETEVVPRAEHRIMLEGGLDIMVSVWRDALDTEDIAAGEKVYDPETNQVRPVDEDQNHG